MGEHSAIEWTNTTWNPIVGCSLVSPGCTNCDAMKMAGRLEKMGIPAYAGLTQPSKAGPVWTGKVTLQESTWLAPLSWLKPRRIVVNAMGDLFHDSIPDEWIDQVFTTMALSPQHTFQVLTKRSARMQGYVGNVATLVRVTASMMTIGVWTLRPKTEWPLRNVWLGVSAEDQTRADERVPHLLATPAAVRFVSAEPLLGPIDFRSIDLHDKHADTGPDAPEWRYDALSQGLKSCGDGPSLATLDWIITGGESGPGARPMHPGWARSIRDQCAAANVPFFFKQWGAWLPGANELHNLDSSPAAHWQDGSWGARHLPPNADQNYLVWDQTGTPHYGTRLGRPRIEIAGFAERVGKHKAGRLLDGVEHNAFPEPRA